MLANEISDPSTLTWEDLKKFYRVANSDRRKLLELMEEELEGADYRDDEIFYSAYLHLAEEDISFLVESDSKLFDRAKPKTVKKTFTARVCAELARCAGVEPREVREDAGELFESGTKERNVHLLLLRARLDEEVFDGVPPSVAENRGEEDARGETREEAPDWDDCVGRVKGLVESLEGPDSDLVLDLLETVQKLQEACDIEERHREENEAAVWGRRRAEFCAILDSLTIDGIPTPSEIRAQFEEASDEDVKRAEPHLAIMEEAALLLSEHREHKEELKREWSALYDQEDDERFAQVNEERKAVKNKEMEQFAQIRAALNSAASALGLDSDAELEGENAVKPQGSEDSPGPVVEAPSTERKADSSEEPAEPEMEPVSDDAPAVEDAALRPTESEGMVEEESKAAEADAVEPCISEKAEGQEDGRVPQPTARVEDLDQSVAALMDANEEALAYHLVALAEERGFKVSIPASVLEAIVTARCVMGPYEQASAPVGKILAQAVSEIEALVDGEESSHIFHGALFAALVRPAILSADTNARIHLQNLSIRGEFACLAKLHGKLSELGHNFQPRVEDLQKIAGANQGSRLTEAKDNLESWVEQARLRHHAHNPTTHILHNLVAPKGRFGLVVKKALINDPKAVHEARELLELYENQPEEIEGLVHEYERSADRPFKDRIREKALAWIQRILLEGCEKLREWLVAKEAEVERLDDRRVAAMQRTVSALTKACEKALNELPDQEAPGLAGAVNRSIRKAIEAGQALLSGAKQSGQYSLSTTRRVDLLKLPASCLPLAPEPGEGDDIFAEERQRQRDRLFDTLLSYSQNPGVGWTEALKARLAESAIGPARGLIKLHRTHGLAPDVEIEDFEADLVDAQAAIARKVTERCEHLERNLTQLASIDLKYMERTREGIDRVRSLKHAVSNKELPFLAEDRRPGVPADFPQAKEFLGKVENLCEEVRRSITKDQRMHLQRVREDHPAIRENVDEILKTLDERDPNTIEDMIASLKAGKPISALEIEESRLFERFFPDFIERMSAEDAPKNPGQVLSAITRNEPIAGLDIHALDEDHRENAQQLIARWGDVRSRFERPAPELKTSASQLLEGCGFTSVELSGGSWIVSKRFRRFEMRCNVPKGTTWFLPPEYGSITNGAYRLYVCRPGVPDDQIEPELGKSAEEAPPILLFLGRMTRARRHEFAQRMRSAHQPILLIDETLLLFLAQSAEARLETLFECTVPFGYSQPYTTDPGDIPAEMFFGRKEEIAKIARRSADGCLVYGGRQLGKSALLHQVRKLYHAPEKGFIVCYRSCDSIGGMGNPASMVWREIAKILSEFEVTRDEEGAPEQVRDAIRAWLHEDTQRRILVLLDETDLFMSAESRSNFANLVKLKELMETTGRHFKVVFAGLHNVHRALRAPNSPLAHLGEPI